jgi:hypothetical protein
MKKYHLQIFCPYIPPIKKFFDSYEDAWNFYVEYFKEKFPFDDGLRRFNWRFCEEQMEIGFSISIIDTEICKNYQDLFLEGHKDTFETIKFRTEHGSDELQESRRPGDPKRRLRRQNDEAGNDVAWSNTACEGASKMDRDAGQEIPG